MPKQTRKYILKIRVSDDELSQLRERSPVNSRGLSPWIRSLALGQRVKKDRFPPVDPQLISSLSRIGNNLNQLARLANTQAASGFDLEAQKVLVVLNEMHEQLDRIEQEHTRDAR